MSAIFNGIIALGTVANLSLVAALFYKWGRYTGETDKTIETVKADITGIRRELEGHFQDDAGADGKIQGTQVEHGKALAVIQVQCASLHDELMLLRRRQHAMVNALMRQHGLSISLESEEGKG